MEKPRAGEWIERFGRKAGNTGFDVKHLGIFHNVPLLALSKPGPPDAPRIYLSAGIHGDEPAGPLALERLMDSGFFTDDTGWSVCPMLNPGGWDPGTRTNPEGIDLNRDYRHARSREVHAHRSWLITQPPNDLFLSLHEDWETDGFYLYEINTTDHPSLAPNILGRAGKIIAPATAEYIDDHKVTSPGLIRHRPEADEPENWPEAIYHLNTYPHLSYTFESPSTLDLPVRIEALAVATQSALEAYRSPRARST